MPAFSLSLSQQQRQMMVLAPQLRQSLEMLQLPLLELRAAIQQEMQTNPTIEEIHDPNELSIETLDSQLPLTDTTASVSEDKVTAAQEADATPLPSPESDSQESDQLKFDDDIERLLRSDDEWRDYFLQDLENAQPSEEANEKRQHFIDSIRQPVSLIDHLIKQLSLTDIDENKMMAAEMLLGFIDEDGYFRADPAELAVQTSLSQTDINGALLAIQELSPAGVGARDLRECLLLQLKIQPPSLQLDLARAIVKEHLADLGANKLAYIARNLGVSLSSIEAAANIVKNLNPRPGSGFVQEHIEYVEPEIFVKNKNGKYVVDVDNDRLPHIRISSYYRKLLDNPETTAEVKSYIRERIRSGVFLIRSIQQRQRTIHRIATVIVDSQQDFFEYGVTRLQPMTMSEVAAQAGVHETTVSRTVANKYMQTPAGLFALKYFFTPGLKSDSGKIISNRTIQDKIAHLVANENSSKPLSDQAIQAVLKEDGINVARRTVAKYRTLLKIAPAHARRRSN